MLIAAERDAKPVSELLAGLEKIYGEIEVVLSVITAIELDPGVYRARTGEQARARREYFDTNFAAIPVEPFTTEMARIAGNLDAEAKRTGRVFP